MLALRHSRALVPANFTHRSQPLDSIRHNVGRRNFMNGLSNGFLDLAAALPIPPTLPPYSTTIIVSTVLIRFALLPIAIWGRNRSRRIEEKVIPEIERLKPIVAKDVFEQMQRERIRGDKKFLQETHKKKCVEILTAKRKALFKEYKCRPIPSMVIPALVQLPPFIIGTMMLARLSVDPTPFDSESFFTLTTLNNPDPTMALPILVGVLTMANVESSNWLLNAAEREKERLLEAQKAKRQAETGEIRIQPRTMIKNALRGLSVVRIIAAAMVPGSVSLYWVTSAAFGLLQTWFFDWQDIRRRRLKERLQVGKLPSSVVPVVGSTQKAESRR